MTVGQGFVNLGGLFFKPSQLTGRQEVISATIDIFYEANNTITLPLKTLRIPAGGIMVGGRLVISDAMQPGTTIEVRLGSDVLLTGKNLDALSTTPFTVFARELTSDEFVEIDVVKGTPPEEDGAFRIMIEYVKIDRASFDQT